MAKNSAYTLFLASIEAPKENPSVVECLRGYETTLLSSIDFLFVATIIHDQDHTDNGEPRRPHLHVFFDLAQGCTLLQCLKRLETLLKCDRTQISLEGSNNEFLGVQYLIHKNHPNKAQYPLDKISTTNHETLIERMGKEYVKPKTEDEILLEAINESNSLYQLAERIGLTSANKYRSTYNQIKQESKTDIEGLYNRVRRAEEDKQQIAYQLTKLISLFNHNGLTLDDILEAQEVLNRIYNL